MTRIINDIQFKSYNKLCLHSKVPLWTLILPRMHSDRGAVATHQVIRTYEQKGTIPLNRDSFGD